MRKPIVASAVTGVVAALAVVPATVTATAKKS
jgi:hypothetical protein